LFLPFERSLLSDQLDMSRFLRFVVHPLVPFRSALFVIDPYASISFLSQPPSIPHVESFLFHPLSLSTVFPIGNLIPTRVLPALFPHDSPVRPAALRLTGRRCPLLRPGRPSPYYTCRISTRLISNPPAFFPLDDIPPTLPSEFTPSRFEDEPIIRVPWTAPI